MDNQKIACQLCGALMHQITYKHLKKHNLTLDQYKHDFPNAPTRSQASLDKKKQGAQKANSTRKGIPRDQKVKDTISQKRKGTPAWNKGKTRTESEKQHQSEIMKEKYQTGQLLHPRLGQKVDAQTRKKISQTLKSQNRTYSEQSKQKRQQTLDFKKQQGWVPDTNREKAKQTQLQLYGCNYNQKHLSFHTLKCLNDKEWLYQQHYINQRSQSSIAEQLNVDQKTVSGYVHYHNLETQNHMVSDQEQQVRSFIDQLYIATICNTRSVIPPYELDIYIPSHNLAIEYCGLYWHSEQAGKDKWYHYNKWKQCYDKGIQLITIFEDEWIEKPNIIKNKLVQLLNCNNQKIFARKTTFDHVTTEHKKHFFDQTHIQGDGPSSINLGLYYQDQLVACCGFSKKSSGVYYLTRYATKQNVVGGFSKLVDRFIKEHSPQQLISFADLRWSDGNVYLTTRWQLDKQLDPDYAYIQNQQRIHKFNFRRKYLPTKLNIFDPKLSERQNCDNNNIPKIWDCGKLRFVLNANIVH